MGAYKRPSEMGMSRSGIILVFAGALLLANNFGLMQWGWLHKWWPLFLILLGGWSILRPGRAERRNTRSADVVAPSREDNRRS